MGCCSNYLFNQIILGQGIPESGPVGPACTVFCFIDGYVGGEVVTEWVIGGATLGAGGVVYTDQPTLELSFQTAFLSNGCLATTAAYNVGGATGVEQTYAWAVITDVSLSPPLTCIAEEQVGDLSGTFVAMQCEQVEVGTSFSTGRTNMTQIESMTVNGFRYNFITNVFSDSATVEGQIQAQLENIWGLTVTSVTVTDLDTDNVDITIISNGTVNELTWDGFSTGTALF